MLIPKSSQHGIRLLVAAVILSAAQAEPLAAPPPPAAQPGLAVHFYGEPTFFLHGGSLVAPALALDLKANQLKWPANNYDAPKGPVFHRGTGWSLAARGAITVSGAGEYVFKTEGDDAALFVDGQKVPADGGAPIVLTAGSHPVALYWKSDVVSGQRAEAANVAVKWKPPGQADFAAVPAEVLTHGSGDIADERAWQPEIPLNNVKPGIATQRELPFEIKEAGLYEIAAHMAGVPRIFQLWLDGDPIFYVQGQRAGQPEQRLDYLGRARTVRYLTRGKHVAVVYGHYGPWVWEDEMDSVLKNMSLGVSRVHGTSPGSLAIRLEDKSGKSRSDMVFRKGEPFIVRLEQRTDAAEAISMEVREQRGNDQVVWSGLAKLAAGKSPAKAELRYPCDKQGAFEYVIKDGAGKTVDGPWAFVVVDATPIPVAKTGGAPSELKGEIVDQVNCALTSDPEHKLRDNGTSQVVDGPAGQYRVTGTNLLRPIAYVQEGKAWRRAKEGEKGAGPSQYAADWFAYTMKVKNPGKPHLLVAYVPNDVRRLVSVAAFDQVTGSYNGWNLEAGDAPEAGALSKLSFLIWPNGNAIDVLTWCSNDNHGSRLNRQGAVAKFELQELAGGLPPAAAPVSGWVPQREVGWEGEQVNLGVVERTTPSLWKGNDFIPGTLPGNIYPGAPYVDWNGLLTAWDRFGQVAGFRGDNLWEAPVYTYGMTSLQGVPHLPKCWDVYSSGYRGRVVDPLERDIFKMMLLVAEKYHQKLVADFIVHRTEDALPPFAKALGCTDMDGIFVSNPSGKVFRTASNNQILNPAHPISRKYFLTVLEEIAARYGEYPSFGGIKIRQWAGWSSALDVWYLNEQNGYDDFTVGLFEKETGHKVAVEDKGEARFALRQKLLQGDLREAWLDWRCQKVQSLLEEGAAVVRRHAPGAKLYSGVILGDDPGTGSNRGGGLDPAKLAGKRDIGFGPHRKFAGEGVEWNYPDPIDFANFDVREPASLRRTMESFHPNSGFSYPAGMCVAESFRSHPYQLEEPAKALANNKLEMFTYGPAWALPPVDEGYRKFVQVFRAIPVLPYVKFKGEGSDQPVFVCWSAPRKRTGGGSETVFYVVNQSAKPHDVRIGFEGNVKSVSNLVDGSRIPVTKGEVPVKLEPFMPEVFVLDHEAAIKSVNITASAEEMDALRQRIESLHAIRERAGALRHVFALAGAAGEGSWDRFASETIDDQSAPIFKAWDAGHPFEAGYLLDQMVAGRTWWFEAFGWPVGEIPKSGPVGILSTPESLLKYLKPEGGAQLDKIPSFSGKFLVVPSGKAVWNAGLTGGTYELRAWGVMGGGYGAIKVLLDGKEIGRIGADMEVACDVKRVLPQHLSLPPGAALLTFQAEGNKGLALRGLELAKLPPLPIKKWSVIGLFDKGTPADSLREGCGVGMDKPFPPEETIDLKADYPGLDGRKVRWAQLDIGGDPFIKLLDKVFPHAADNGVAYLASWVKSPSDRDTELFYAMDWAGKVWVNDALVVPKIAGPYQHFVTQKIHLKAGWNKILAKTTRGTDGWMANFAVSDPGDLQYAPTPPENPAPKQ